MILDDKAKFDSGTAKPAAAVHTLFRQVKPAGAPARRIALIGNFVPRKCGIATFTNDVFEKLGQFHPEITVDVYALDDPGSPLPYEGIAGTIDFNDPEAYARAARRINETGVDAVWLQHEYGIFGGPEGQMVCDFVDHLAAPLILTPHTVLAEPSDLQRSILHHLIERASRLMVMSRHSCGLLDSVYGAPSEILEVIPHGAPDRPFGRSEQFKARMGLSGKNVLMTFGLLSPGKGLERVIEALPGIVECHPNTVYRIVGATHPNLVREQGEAYREKLMAEAEALGVADHIQWENRFLDTEELLDQLEACDIYVTPYFNLQQSTSGTLSYAVALGKAVVSTPYLHARELLSGEAGILIQPDCAASVTDAVNLLLDNPDELVALQRRAYAKGRQTIWPRFADASAGLIESAVARHPRPAPLTATPGLSAVFAMSDATGMLQHSIDVVPDRRHGYCLDDNVRALMLMNVAAGLDEVERMRWSQTFASFVQHAWNEEAKGFRNFMRFDRSWCEDLGSEDSNGRTVWALGHTVEHARDQSLRDWARRWYDNALPRASQMESPRARAFTMLGAAAVLRTDPTHNASREVLERGGEFLQRLLSAERRPDWAWFEAVLGYDNPRLPQALIEAGTELERPDFVEAGLETLEWIAGKQLSAAGYFRPIGSETFGKPHASLPFDQQPLEAQAAVDAAAAAWRATRDPKWFEHAQVAYRWLFGANDRGVVLADLSTGRCRDGITPRGANRNCGAESILAFQLAHYSVLALADAQPRDSVGGKVSGSRGRLAEQPVAYT